MFARLHILETTPEQHPMGQAMYKVTVFNARTVGGTEPQILARKLVDTRGKLVCLAEIKEMIDAEDVREHLRTDYREAPTDEKREILLSAIEATKKQLELVNGKVAQMTDMRDIWAQKLDRYHELLQNLPE